MEATKVKVRERGTLSSSHMTSNPLSASLPPPRLSSPLPSPPRPSSHTFRHTGFSARLENDTILQEDRTLMVKTASFVEQGYVTSRVLSVSTFHRALRSRFREGSRLKRCAAVEKARIAFFPAPLLDQRADSRYLRIGDGGATVTHRPAVTQRNA